MLAQLMAARANRGGEGCFMKPKGPKAYAVLGYLKASGVFVDFSSLESLG
jgi:hypothetical protein